MADTENPQVDEAPPVQPVQKEPAVKEPMVRVIVVDRCGPSPRRCLYSPDCTYNVPQSEADWLLQNRHAYVEGGDPVDPFWLRKQRAIEIAREAEEAARVAHAENVRAWRADRVAERQAAVDKATAESAARAAAIEAERKAEAEAKQRREALERQEHAAKTMAARKARFDAAQDAVDGGGE